MSATTPTPIPACTTIYQGVIVDDPWQTEKWRVNQMLQNCHQYGAGRVRLHAVRCPESKRKNHNSHLWMEITVEVDGIFYQSKPLYSHKTVDYVFSFCLAATRNVGKLGPAHIAEWNPDWKDSVAQIRVAGGLAGHDVASAYQLGLRHGWCDGTDAALAHFDLILATHEAAIIRPHLAPASAPPDTQED
jgi:hypothetical protein